MRSFPLQIVTADGMVFDGQAESISVRAAGGDMSVQAGHCDYVTVLGMGQARLIVDGKVRTRCLHRRHAGGGGRQGAPCSDYL